MAVIEGGVTGNLVEVDSTFSAQRVSIRPYDYSAYGTYLLSAATTVMAAGLAAGSEVLQFRWTDPTRLCVIQRVVVDGGANAGTAFAAGVARVEGVIARSWSADGSGGTAMVMTGNNQKARTSMATSITSSAGSIRVATTAALTAGTKVLDSQAFGSTLGGVVATAGTQFWGSDTSIYDAASGIMHPLILAQNEGFILRATVPATGTWTAAFSIRWTEMAAF